MDYFYRGNIDIQPVEGGVTFRSIRFNARNTTPNGEEMEPGEVALVVRCKGMTALLWAQDGDYQNTKVGGDWSWETVRNVYNSYLTAETECAVASNCLN